MKTKITAILFALGLLIAVTAFAKEPAPASKAVAQSVAKLIQSEMDYPEFAIKEKFQGDVTVSLEILEDGSFNVDGANCVNAEMKEYVIEQIENIVSEKHARYAGQTVLLKIKFDLRLY